MAADLYLGDDPTATELTDSEAVDSAFEVPSLFASIESENLEAESLIVEPDKAAPVQNEPVTEEPLAEPLAELVAVLDLQDSQSIELEAQTNQTLILNLEPSQLESLFGQSETMAVHVVIDAARWQLPVSRIDLDLRGDTETNQPIALPQIDSQIQLVSLEDQKVRIQANVQLGNAEEGTLTQIVIKLTDGDPQMKAEPQKWQAKELELVRDWIFMESISPSLDSDASGPDVNEDRSHEDFTSTIDPIEKVEHGPEEPVGAWTGEKPGNAKPFEESEVSPLPETSRDDSERNARTVRRSLDIRSPISLAWSAPMTSTKAAVTPGSLATQKAIARVYDDDSPIASAPARWTLDSKPARLQVATFVLSRVDRRDASVVMNTAKPVAKIHSQSTAEYTFAETQTAKTTANPTTIPTTRVSTHEETPIRIAVVPSEAEVSVDSRALRRVDEIKADEDETIAELSLYAAIVDRLFGSPVRLVAVLGLTVVIRFAETDECTSTGKAMVKS